MKNIFTGFFDDPAKKISYVFKEKEQIWIRNIIKNKYDGNINPQVFWFHGSATRDEGLSDDEVERFAQRLTFSNIGQFMAHRMWAKLAFFILPFIVLMSFVFNYFLVNISGATRNAYLYPVAFALLLWCATVLLLSTSFLSPMFAQLFLPRIAVKKDEAELVENIIKNSVVRDLPEDTPKDMQDRLRILDVDAHGRAIAGQIQASDFDISAVRVQWQLIKKALLLSSLVVLQSILFVYSPIMTILVYLPVAGAYIYTLRDEQEAPSEPEYYANQRIQRFGLMIVIPFVYFWIVALGVPQFLDAKIHNIVMLTQWGMLVFSWYMVFDTIKAESPLRKRGQLLENSVQESGTEFLIDKAGRGYFVNLEKARLVQLKNTIADKSEFLSVGKTTGILSQRRDALAPSEAGLPSGLTIKDLSTHLAVLGASGTGKTYNIIRPLTQKWIELNQGGLFVLDGKGVLPLEFVNQGNYRLISPDSSQFNPIATMEADTVADTLVDVFNDADDDKFWADSARYMLRMAAVVIKASNQVFTLNEIQRFCTGTNTDRMAILDTIEHKINDDAQLYTAVMYWMQDFINMPEKTSGSIVNMIRTWLGNITAHQELGVWVDTSDTGNIEDVFKGEKMGLALPESRYGVGGVAISALCMRRLYDAAKKRGDEWRTVDGQKPVLLAADEVQNLLGKHDLENVPIARSLGLSLLFATQNIDGLYPRLKKEGAFQMLGNFASLIALPVKTEDSNKYISERVGKVWKAYTDSYKGLPDAASDMGIYLNSGADNMLQNTKITREGAYGSPRLSHSVNAWKNAPQVGKKNPQGTHSNVGERPLIKIEPTHLVNPDEIDTLLSAPQTAIAIFNRGGVVRRDIIQLG